MENKKMEMILDKISQVRELILIKKINEFWNDYYDTDLTQQENSHIYYMNELNGQKFLPSRILYADISNFSLEDRFFKVLNSGETFISFNNLSLETFHFAEMLCKYTDEYIDYFLEE